MAGSTRVGLLGFLILIMSVMGCESTPRTEAGSSSSGPLAGAVAAYRAGRYEEASRQAGEALRSKSPDQRQEAAYLAGLIAYRLGNTGEAERRLMVAAGSDRPETAGKAKAMMGIIRLDQNRPREAALLFEAAADLLTGADAAKAREHVRMARRMTAEPVGQGAAAAVTGQAARIGGGFSLQVGAFRQEQGAQLAAADARDVAAGAGLGPVRIVPSLDEEGSRLFLVQFGLFSTRAAAAAARREVGRLEYLVMPLAVAGASRSP